MPAFRTGIDEAKQAYGNHQFADLSLDERKAMCMDVLTEIGARNITEKGRHELYHSCLLPFGNHPNGDRNPSASINYEKMTAACFVCGGGGWLWWVALVKGMETSDEARQWVVDKVGPKRVDTLAEILTFLDSLLVPTAEYKPPTPVYDPSVLKKWMFIHPYVTENRHIPMETIVRLKIGYGILPVKVAEDTFVQSHRIVIPHFFDGKLYGWQSRRLGNDNTPKYLTTPDMPKEETLFDYRMANGADLIVVESPMSVMRHAHQAYVTATFGSSVSEQQIDLMLRTKAKRVVLWFDNDTAGWNATERVGELLSQRTVAWAVQCPFEGDPCDLNDETFQRVLDTCLIPFALWVRPDGDGLIGASDDNQEVWTRQGDR